MFRIYMWSNLFAVITIWLRATQRYCLVCIVWNQRLSLTKKRMLWNLLSSQQSQNALIDEEGWSIHRKCPKDSRRQAGIKPSNSNCFINPFCDRNRWWSFNMEVRRHYTAGTILNKSTIGFLLRKLTFWRYHSEWQWTKKEMKQGHQRWNLKPPLKARRMVMCSVMWEARKGKAYLITRPP